jgi:hypothetical protein
MWLWWLAGVQVQEQVGGAPSCMQDRGGDQVPTVSEVCHLPAVCRWRCLKPSCDLCLPLHSSLGLTKLHGSEGGRVHHIELNLGSCGCLLLATCRALHEEMARRGLAAGLLGVQVLEGGFTLVKMEYLAPDQGWVQVGRSTAHCLAWLLHY